MTQIPPCPMSAAVPHIVDLGALPSGELPAVLSGLARERLTSGVVLGTADDGIVWGVLDGSNLRFEALVGPKVGARPRVATLQALRVFGIEGEIRLFRRRSQLCATWLAEGPPRPGWAHLDRSFRLIGSPDRGLEGEFTVLRGRRGEVHAPPIPPSRAPSLTVREYLRSDPETGAWEIVYTRWLSLGAGTAEETSDGS